MAGLYSVYKYNCRSMHLLCLSLYSGQKRITCRLPTSRAADSTIIDVVVAFDALVLQFDAPQLFSLHSSGRPVDCCLQNRSVTSLSRVGYFN